MAPVMVRPPSVGLKVMIPLSPAARATTIVSPTAREMPRMTAAMMPEMAAGKDHP